MTRPIYLKSTLSGKRELLVPLTKGHIGIYACGVTTYDHYHIGHALQAIYFDMIWSYLEYAGYGVTYVRNYTDVDDKIIIRAQDRQISPMELSEEIIASSEEDMAALGCRKPSFSPRVSQSIPEIIAMVETLIENKAAYPTEAGDVYYRVRQNPEYGKLSNRKVEELQSGTRDIVQSDKEDDLDFALWKADTTEGASWKSPWGPGRPGWHIECSAMSKIHLGNTFDIHGGGLDLVFPHHENEIAQSESANKCEYAKYWIHSGLLTIEKQKMSKSTGNQITLKDFLKKWPAEVLRLAYLQHHYASNIDFQKDTFKKAHQRLYYYYSTLASLEELAKKSDSDAGILPGYSTENMVEQFHKAMSDDFNSALALGNLNKEMKKANELITSKKSAAKFHTAKSLVATFRELFKVFGMLQQPPAEFLEELRIRILPELSITEDEIDKLISNRKQARTDKDFALGDQLRDQLAERGIELMDTPQGTTWKIKYDE